MVTFWLHRPNSGTVIPVNVEEQPMNSDSSAKVENESVTKIENADFSGSRMVGVSFSSVVIFNTSLSGADLREVNFQRSEVLYTNFVGSNLRGANFTNAKIRSSDFTRANLQNADLKFANLGNSDFSGADLRGATIENANLSGARLENVRGLTYEMLKNVVINEFTTLPSQFTSLRSNLLRNSKIRYTEIKKAMPSEDLERYTEAFDFLEK